jgi:signal transduction histidine kinase
MRMPKRQLLLLLNAGLVFFFLLRAVPAPAQQATREIDSLWKVVGSLKGSDKTTLLTKKQKLSDMFGLALYGDVPIALRITDSLAETCRRLGDSAGYYEALYRNKASIYEPTYDYRKTFNYLNQYAIAIKRLGIQNGYSYVDVGNLYYSFGLSDISAAYYRKADEIFKVQKNYHGQCTVLDNLALIWREKNNYDSCLWYYNQSASIRKNILRDPYLEAYNYVQIANALTIFNRVPESYSYLNSARNIFEQKSFEQYKDFESMKEARVVCYRFLASYFIGQNQLDSATFYYSKAKQQAVQYQLIRQMVSVNNIGTQIDLAKGDYAGAISKLKESEALARKRKDDYALLNIYELYIRYYEKQGDWKNASLMHDRRYKLNDSLSLVNNDDQMLVMNNALLQFDNETQIEKQNNILARQQDEMRQSENEKNFLLIGLAGLTIVIFMVILFLFQYRAKNKLAEKYTRELEEANRTKQKLLSVISHDLRSPFNTLIGMSNLLVANVKRNDYGQLASNAEAINESSRKAYLLLDNLMQWVSVQKENISVSKKQVPLGPLVDEILLLFRNQALAQNVTIGKDLRVQSVFTDSNMLQVMLRNLLSNAVRHIPAGGIVNLRIEAAGKDVLMTIRDNGKGIDPEILDSLFKTKEGISIAKKGGGLGLELVQEFVEKLGGSITAENAAEGGAVFRIRLFDAAVSKMVAAAAEIEAQKLKLNPQERGQLKPLVLKMRDYEIFDTTELRKLLEEDDSGKSDSVSEWKKRMHQAVYHSDAVLFGKLLELVEKEHENI